LDEKRNEDLLLLHCATQGVHSFITYGKKERNNRMHIADAATESSILKSNIQAVQQRLCKSKFLKEAVMKPGRS
jgi:hypothetical protein